MKTIWDYSSLADAYLKRPEYSAEALSNMFNLAKLNDGDSVCDVGAGVAHLTIPMLERGYRVTAVEPNDAMRENGIKRTSKYPNVEWYEGTGEETGRQDSTFSLVTFGSSFNVVNQAKALIEAKRILKPRGWFACMWNHRNLEDDIQSKIEKIIGSHISGYQYGERRVDQTNVIESSGLFGAVTKIEKPIVHQQSIEDCVQAWRSHATLHRQAGDTFSKIISEIERFLCDLDRPVITIPYTTRLWIAQVAT